jgi:hypothetical protein
MFAVTEMPTALKKVTAVLDPELQAALEKYAARSKRSLSNAASILLEQALIVTGDLPGPIERQEKRGGKRTGAGRKPKALPNFREWLTTQLRDDSTIGDLAQDAIGDSGWTGSTVRSLRERMESRGAQSQALRALNEASQEYAEFIEKMTSD